MIDLDSRCVESDVCCWWFDAVLKYAATEEWYFVDEQSQTLFIRDWLIYKFEKSNILDGKLFTDFIEKGNIVEAGLLLGDLLEETYKWGVMKLDSYTPDALTAMGEAIDA